MEINLETKVEQLKGVGPKIAPKLNKLGIFTVSDLIYHYPRRYEDYTQITKISDLGISNDQFPISKKFSNSKFEIKKTASYKLTAESYTIRARIIGIANKRTRRRGFAVTEAVVEDGTGTLKVVWFNQPYLAKMLRAGSEVILNGKVEYDSFSHGLVMESPNRANRPKIVPVYPETAGISSYFLARQIANIKSQIAKIKEYLPQEIIDKFDLLGLRSALKNIHEPENSEALGKARRRIAFDELFLISLRSQIVKEEITRENASKIEISDQELKKFADFLPFELTADQKKASWEIILDLKGREANSLKLTADSFVTPMNRLLSGDVGSGKTAVAAFAAYVTVKAGFRVAFMAPTEILAKQHYGTLCDIFAKLGISVGLITATDKKLQIANHKSQTNSKSKISNIQKADIIIGTHAILHDKIKIENLGLVIVDEQHRFGVNQRAKLLEITNRKSQITNKNGNCEIGKLNENCPNGSRGKSREKLKIENLQYRPHFLSMTATPIPRSLHLALFGDLDLSIIKSMPKGRKPIKTRFVEENNRSKAYEFIRQQIRAGRQAFVICPLIEEGEASSRETLFDEDRKSVLAEYERLRNTIFPELRIGMLHGKMKSAEKDAVMAHFKSRKLDILVSTSVVEVGVDIPNATIMMVEDAERFGLAQLHQFRGRVGRGEHQSFCFVFSNSRNPRAIERLKSFENILDGFKLAEIDLKNRGAGDMFGTIQSGYNELRMASYSDVQLIQEAAEAAKIVAKEIENYPAIKEKVGQFLEHKHLE